MTNGAWSLKVEVRDGRVNGLARQNNENGGNKLRPEVLEPDHH